MKPLLLFILFAAGVVAQTKPELLASSTVADFTADSLTSGARELWDKRNDTIAETRSHLLAEMITDRLFSLEAASQKTTVEKLTASIAAQAAEPTTQQIQAVYDANRNQLEGVSQDEVRPRIVSFLKQQETNRLMQEFINGLEKKHGVTYGKGVNAKPLLPADVLAKVGMTSITAKTFEDTNRVELAKKWYEIYAQMRTDLVGSIYSTIVTKEAESLNIDSSEYISREITSKIKNYTDEERETLEDALQRRLFTKYKVKFLANEPFRAAQTVATDDDPSSGLATAAVTIVMFTDFQCPACSRAHPVIKRILAEYGSKVRFVVRDFPLEKIHENAFIAARAAAAANAQGKFAAYTDKLYTNQGSLDRKSLTKYAAELGLNVKQFELDFSSEKTAAEIRKDIADGKGYGIGGTPAVFVNGSNVWPLSWELRLAIDRALIR
ncbi:MAG TPA: thioredoxin domain-containing protein [Pyrinomonadaceae bacterium]|nr:thioredoxin domain-containing protein [Pyrinomonadaceae bacterium]